MALALGPYLNAREAAKYCAFTDDAGVLQMKAFYAWVAEHHVTKKHRGRRLLFRPDDLDRAVEEGKDPFVARALAIAAGGKR